MKKIEKALAKLLKKISKLDNKKVYYRANMHNSEVVHHVIFGDRLNPLKSLKKWRNLVGG